MPFNPKVNVGVSLAVYRKVLKPVFRVEVLLGLRCGTLEAGLWAMPGGWMDPGEQPSETATRELKEETGLTLRSRPFLLNTVAYRLAEIDIWVTNIAYASRYEATDGIAVAMEPTKNKDWSWFEIEKGLPTNMQTGSQDACRWLWSAILTQGR